MVNLMSILPLAIRTWTIGVRFIHQDLHTTALTMTFLAGLFLLVVKSLKLTVNNKDTYLHTQNFTCLHT